jgi:hypothetical protein
MKKILALIFVLSVFTTTFGQNKNSISLIREKMELPDRKFYIDSIVDNRIDKSNIGIVRKGLFSSKQLLQLQGGLTSSLKEYYDYLLPKGVDQVPILLKINKLEVSEKAGPGVVYGFVDVYIEYYQGDRLLCGSKQHIEVSDIEVTRLHEENIREALKKSLLEFANSAWNSRDEQNKQVSKPNVMPTVSEASVGEPQKESNAVQASPAESPKRNTFTVGYQIGGYSLIGFDYEIRMHNYVGAHIGAGLAGYTYGIMIHTNPKRTSPFFNISYHYCPTKIMETS